MTALKKKLRSRAGESFAETLVALLIAAIALTMLAGMITATANLVKKSEDKMDEYYEKSRKIEEISAGTDTESVYLTIASTDTTIKKDNIPVYQIQNGTFQKTPVIAYSYESHESGTGDGDGA